MDDSTLLCGIYAIVNTVTGQAYIGLTRNSFAVRWMVHRDQLARNAHHNAALQADWNTYGADVFAFRILEVIDQEQAAAVFLDRERFYIGQEQQPVYNGRPNTGDSLERPCRSSPSPPASPTVVEFHDVTFSERIEHLFEARRRSDGRLYTNKDICEWIGEHVLVWS